MRSFLKGFLKGFLIGTACICLLALAWLVIYRPSLVRYETEALKAAYSQPGPGASRSGALPAGEEPQAPALDLAALQEQYPDVRAWLTIPGTVVDYPVLQSGPDDPEYYLRRNYMGEWRTAGSLFFQSDCVWESRSLVVYGHNMSDGTMFACLPQFMRGENTQKHGNIQLQTLDGVRHYRIAAVLETDIYKVPFNRTSFSSDEDFLSFAEELINHAAVTTGIPISADSRLLVLVTCSYSWPDARYVVVAVETPPEIS